jgi:hypothetical protein
MPEDMGEELYQLAMARVVSRCLTNHPRLRAYLDRRYTNRHQAIQLEQAIRQAVSHIPLRLFAELQNGSKRDRSSPDFLNSAAN